MFNVGVLLDQGYTEAARIALEKGPVIGGTLAKELVAATPEVRAQFEEQAAATRETLTAAEVYIREVATPGLIGAEGDLARAATQAYAYNLNLDAATTYGLGLAAQVLAENRAVDEQASARGRDVGRTFTEGISAGMALALEGLLATVSATVDAAYLEARRASRSRSPSLLFAGLGEDWMAGLASGIDRSSTMVDDSIGRVVATAATTPTVTPPIPNVGDTYGDVNIGPITVNVPEGMTAGQARTLGREIGRGAAAEISRAGLIRTQIRAL
ncbi:MAG: hypothetical protein M5U14_09615 [Acidimicrobiia bacterium]|nr:hypothetical protein [Acidimicrobiia bacterium]